MSLLVKTYLKESSIPNAGIGCFAAQFIPKGTKIWQFSSLIDRIYTEEEFNSAGNLEKEFLTRYCYKSRRRYILCVDNARFFNHSEDCNTYDTNDSDNEYENITYALKDIQEGEEIVSDYRFFGTMDDEEFNLSI